MGQSDWAETPYTTADMADDVAALLDPLQASPAHIVGHSLGGLVAQQFALRYPSQARSLVLASCHAGAEPWRVAVLESWVLLKRRTDAAEFSRATLPWLVAPAFYQNTTQIEGLVRFAERNHWPQPADAFERQARAAMTHETRGRLHEIQVPTLVLVGTADLVNPPRVAQELARGIAGARYHELEGVGHLPHVEAVGQFRDLVTGFLDSLEDPQRIPEPGGPVSWPRS